MSESLLEYYIIISKSLPSRLDSIIQFFDPLVRELNLLLYHTVRLLLYLHH